MLGNSPTLCHLLMFLKWPAPGKTKTRLAATIGDQSACAMYRRMAEYTVHLARTLPTEEWQVTILTDGAEAADFKGWLGDDITLRPQAAGDLGRRLEAGFTDAEANGAKQVMVIGGDCPDLTVDHLQHAKAELAQKDVIIGPAGDGGYYLLGCRKPAAGLFDGIDWSTARVLAQTIEGCRQKNYTVERLEVLRDIDTEGDARACGLLNDFADAG